MTMAETDTEREQREKDVQERQEKAPYTGVLTLHDVVRHLVTHGPARNDAERAELLGVVDEDDPDVTVEKEPDLTADEKAAEYDRLQGGK